VTVIAVGVEDGARATDDAVAPIALEDVVAVEVVGFGSSDAPTMMSTAVPTTTHTPTRTRHARSARLGLVAASGKSTRERRACERGAGTAAGEKT
jgi:hypothetical protein